jgi:hypothetical protein
MQTLQSHSQENPCFDFSDTGGEQWAFKYDPEKKCQSTQWISSHHRGPRMLLYSQTTQPPPP